ncbi:LIC11113 family protein [Leptospira idonii]|uniref:Uncharacterized protein n=1 Tax=Leptospira idonii TaxID=1193500 RepID=A0A4R9LVY5_9LEPT|nr:hypothetical protein [Leptospira idonii]TGN17183.1 hypothetical protein EHS15_18600 [Leptospira idonii]
MYNPLSPNMFSQFQLTVLSLLMPLFYAGAGLEAGKIHSGKKQTSLSLLYEELKADGKITIGVQIKNWIRNKNLFAFQDSSGCKLKGSGSYQTVRYYSLDCESGNKEGLIRFSQAKLEKQIPPGHFRLAGYHKIGNKNYLEVVMGPSEVDNIAANQTHTYNKNDLEFDYPGTKSVFTSKTEKKNSFRELKNPNLIYFKTIAYDENRRKESPSSIEVFFDDTCPLLFQEVDESFYWDNTISYVFQISCVKNTPYALVRVPGNPAGKLEVSGVVSGNPAKGDRFFAKLKMRKITNEQAFWEEHKLFYE